jgi:hypothetical protein
VGRITNNESGFDENAVNLFPNPSMGDVLMSLFSAEDLEIEMTVYNYIGQAIAERTFDAPKGNTVVNVDSGEWAAGVYNIQLTDTQTGQTVNKRFIKN